MKRSLPVILVAVVLLAAGVVRFHPWREQPTPLQGRVLDVHFLDVGQGDCILIRTPDARGILVDAGDESTADEVVRYLKDQGVNQIDLLVITHPHGDHIGGLPAVLEAFGVSRVLDAGHAHGSQTYRSVLSTIEARRIDYKLASDFRNPPVCEGVTFEVLWPPPEYGPEGDEGLNDGSIVLRVKYGGVAVLLAGDIQSDAEGKLLASGQDLRSAILKVAHHGSDSSTSNEFVQAVTPAYAVISVGADNPYGHPSKTILERLAAIGATVYRTDEQGTIVISTDGRAVRARSER
jgi:beta-lactamase superfamily II metal-dependent hydrolase